MDDKGTIVLCDAIECKHSDGAMFLAGSTVFVCPKKIVNLFMSVTGATKCISYEKDGAEGAGGEQ